MNESHLRVYTEVRPYKGLTPLDVQSGDTHEFARVEAARLAEGLGDDGDSGVDRVGDHTNHGVRAVGCDAPCDALDDACVHLRTDRIRRE